MKRASAALFLILVACTSSRQNDELPSTIPPADVQGTAATAATDARVAELQTTLTELLDRIDVLNARIAKLESGAPPQAAPPPNNADRNVGAPRATQSVADEYRHAITLVGQSKYPEARVAFQRVFDAEPSGELADNSLFWIGETYFAAGNYSEAMRHYARVSKEYPEANKAPDAVFKTAIAYVRTGDLGMARRTFEEVISRYPYSAPAAAARMELKKIKY